jgi:hypothetical protein
MMMSTTVNKHRSWTPWQCEANLLIYFVNLADNRGPDRRRPGPHPERISSRYIKALRSSEFESRFGAYSPFSACISVEILIVAKLENVSDTAYGKMIWPLCLIAPQV